MKIIVNIDNHAHAQLDRPPTPPKHDASTRDQLAPSIHQRLESQIDQLTIAQKHRRP